MVFSGRYPVLCTATYIYNDKQDVFENVFIKPIQMFEI